MQHEENRAELGIDDPRHDDLQNQQQHGSGRSIRPAAPIPPTVPVTDMGDGFLPLQGWRDGPSAYLSPSDAVRLRRELSGAFRSEGVALCGHPGENR